MFSRVNGLRSSIYRRRIQCSLIWVKICWQHTDKAKYYLTSLGFCVRLTDIHLVSIFGSWQQKLGQAVSKHLWSWASWWKDSLIQIDCTEFKLIWVQRSRMSALNFYLISIRSNWLSGHLICRGSRLCPCPRSNSLEVHWYQLFNWKLGKFTCKRSLKSRYPKNGAKFKTCSLIRRTRNLYRCIRVNMEFILMRVWAHLNLKSCNSKGNRCMKDKHFDSKNIIKLLNFKHNH